MKQLFSRLISISAIFFILVGCAAGPDFYPPDLSVPEQYMPESFPTRTVSAGSDESDEVQRFAFAEDLPAQWWKLFKSSALDQMIRQGLANSPTLAAAQAALRKAEEDLRAVKGSIVYPAVDADLQATRQRTSGNANSGASNTYNLYNTSVAVSYTLDMFGGGRRQIEAYQAEVDYRRYTYEAAYLTLTANIVTTAVQEASLRAKEKATIDIIAMQQKQLGIIQKQFELGAVSKADVLSQETDLATTKADLPTLGKELALSRHALAALTGQFPGSAKMPEFNLESLHLPQELPVSLPSQLVRQRPDIRASEELLHQACAEVGVATANLYPQITLSGGYGFQAVGTGVLFNGKSIIWNLGTGLVQPLFRGGQLTAQRRSALAAYDQATAEYRQTVLEAFQNVADVLRALEADARMLRARVEAETAAKATLALVENQYKLGATTSLALLTARRDYQEACIDVITARAQRYEDTAALFQALGGGW
jgi:NodT family efflux transporter outer membrane factor (OMF) lipoprotein